MINRVRVAKDKAELIQALLDIQENTGPFQTYADVVAFAASLGAKFNKKEPLLEISTKEPAPINLDVFISRGYDWLIKLLAITTTNDPSILSVYNHEAEKERITIFEEYANGGLEILRNELKGSADYTERILLIMGETRLTQDISSGEFDLTKFL
jgi:dnd system-associated protein 4